MKRLENQDTTNLRLFNLPLLKNSEVVVRVRRWIEILRSGDYIQGQTALSYMSTDGSCKYCCLGVAHNAFNFSEDAETDGNLWNSYELLGLQSASGMCYALRDERYFGGGISLVTLNDSRNWNFNEIAQLLEDQLNVCLKELEETQ